MVYLKSDPGIYNLISSALLAKEIRKELIEGDDLTSGEQKDILQDCIEAEKIIHNYFDSLISCMNPVGKAYWQKPLIHPCKKTFEEVIRDLRQDYIDIANSVQGHSKCSSAY